MLHFLAAERRRPSPSRTSPAREGAPSPPAPPGSRSRPLYILQRGVQWKQGVVVYMTLYTSLLYNTTPIHCTPDPLHPPLQSIQ